MKNYENLVKELNKLKTKSNFTNNSIEDIRKKSYDLILKIRKS